MTVPKYVYCFPAFFSLAAFVLACVGIACDFLSFKSTEHSVIDPTTGKTEPVSLKFGLWYYQSYEVEDSTVTEGSCNVYPSSMEIDNVWHAARSFNLIAVILGGSILMLDIFQGCLSTKPNRSFRTGAVMYSICSLCAGLSLILLNSNACKNNILIQELNQKVPELHMQETCSISKGAKCTIAATVLWFVTAVSACYLHPIQKKEQQRDESDGLDEPLFNEENTISGP